MTHFADNETLDAINEMQQRITELEADNARLREALEPFAKFACDPPCGCFNCKARESIASTSSTWLADKLAEERRKVLEEAAQWFEGCGCTILPSSIECAQELRRMAEGKP